jgi:excisionase family DNA binding protein
METEKYYSIEEVSKLLKVAYLTVYRWVRAKKLVAYKAGKQYRVKKEDLDSFMKEKV